MTDSKNTQPADDQHLFENDFVYVNAEGDVILKKTNLFEERTLATVDPESVEARIEAFEKIFSGLEQKVDTFLESAEETVKESPEKADEKLGELIDEIKGAEAVGDFEKLVNSAKERLEELKEAAKPTEAEEQDSEAEASKEKSDEVEAKEESEAAVETAEPEAEEKEEAKAEEAPAEEEETKDSDEEDDPLSYYKELEKKAEELMDMTDWAYVSMEFDNIDNAWSEGPDAEDEEIQPLKDKIDKLREDFEQKKKAHYEEKQRRRLENLEKKKDLLNQLKEIVDEKKWSHTKDVGRIKGRWEQIKSVPEDEAEKLESKFESLLSTFDEHKVDRLVKQKQKEEDNLTGKLVILEKMEGFVSGLDETADWPEQEKKFDELTKQFRKIGRVPSEKNREVWARYHSAQDTFHSMRFKYDKKYREQIEKFLSKKKKLIDEAEALLDADDLADAARRVNKLHRRWKKVGNLPQKDENEMWDRFKAATDAFNDKKSENLDVLKEQEEENYEEKLKIVEKANELKESEDWEATHKALQGLMDTWKKVGPVPKKKSGKIWKKFKGAMDHFYDRRRDHFKEVKEERKDNLKEKEEVLEKLAELKSHDDPIEAVEKAKPLQEEFKKAGYVPIKHKNRLWKEYRETCDVIYDRFRAAKAAVDVVGRENVENFSADDIADIRKKQSEINKLRKEVGKLTGEVLQMKESLSYFKPSGGSSSLLDDVKEKISKAENKLESKEDKLADLEKEVDQIKKDS
ncbi:DUF349 domain-containing protein [Rhodohalobacter sp.]|uniref:DUF349 domain-containing protein n=1 Tax=Rhodohalobacter sp. TaxID=1974210 RepID=UPI002ACE33C6|nr:DUF349 domain-containing protein [Rhodohalobacter sp.]MDZ7758463.1 DUF349 domain-containing protein [Rhodohalobacter sp.]